MRYFFLLAAVCLLIGCNEGTPVSTDLAPALENVNENGGDIVRYDADYWLMAFWNEAEGIFSVHSSKDHFFCKDGLINWDTQEGETTSPVRYHWVEGPFYEEMSRNNKLNATGERLFTVVFRASEPVPQEQLCVALLDPVENGIVAEGLVNFKHNDNDWWLQGPGANSWIWNITGQLDDLINGGKVHFSMIGKGVIVSWDPWKFNEHNIGPTLR